MRNAFVTVGVVLLAVVGNRTSVEAGGPCRECGGATAAHEPYTGSGCGPRVWGPCHEPVGPIDQCDACARFRGCNGYRQMPEWLAPWQLPPGRGFQPPEAHGYHPGPCAECAACGPSAAWWRGW